MPALRTALPSGEVHLVYRLDVNEYQNQRRLQLLVDRVLPRERQLLECASFFAWHRKSQWNLISSGASSKT